MRSTRQGRLDASDRRHSVFAAAAAAGTLLAGVAAAGGLVLTTFVQRGDETTGQGSVQSAPTTSALPPVYSFESLSNQLGAIASKRMDVDSDAAYASFTRWTAQNGDVSFEAPIEWMDVETTNWLDDQDALLGAAVLAAPSIDELYQGWDTPGVFVGASPNTVSVQTLLNQRATIRGQTCSQYGRGTFFADGFAGAYVVWSACAGRDTVIVDLAANHREHAGTLVLHFRATSRRDRVAMETLLGSLRVDMTSVIRQNGRLAPGRVID